MQKEIESAIKNGLAFLSKEQKENGSFQSLSSFNPKDFKKARKYHSIFPTCLILSCLNNLNNYRGLEETKKKAARFLIAQKSEHWSFNYWERNSRETKTLPYPDDLDDTFCALSALFEFDPKIITGEALAKITMLLTALEEKEGGPYKTWLVSEESSKNWKDVDLAVNSNIAYFLGLQGITLKNIKNLVEKAIQKQKFHSPYYPSAYPIIYYISRFLKGENKKLLVKYITEKQKPDGSWENPLDTALSVSSLINLGFSPNKLEKAISFLLSKQKNHCWPARAFCIDPAINKKTYYSGSSHLTTAFCLEAFQKYLKATNKIKPKKDFDEDRIKKLILKNVHQNLLRFPKEMQNEFQKNIQLVLKNDKNSQITLLPSFFQKCLGKNGENIPEDFLARLGTANLYGWLAYTIYDGFLDEEGAPQRLPLANICLRELSQIFFGIFPGKNEFFPIFSQIMDEIEKANFWETSFCRAKIDKRKIIIPSKFPDYGNYERLAQRSIGHALGPIAILYFLGYGKNSPEMKNLLLFFRHYIIARQLNDDAHDWEEDLKNRRLSPVVVEVAKKYRKKYKRNCIDPEKDSPLLQEIFWHETVRDISREIVKNINLAGKALKNISVLENPDSLKKLIEPIKKSAQNTLAEQRNAISFLKHFGN